MLSAPICASFSLFTLQNREEEKKTNELLDQRFVCQFYTALLDMHVPYAAASSLVSLGIISLLNHRTVSQNGNFVRIERMRYKPYYTVFTTADKAIPFGLVGKNSNSIGVHCAYVRAYTWNCTIDGFCMILLTTVNYRMALVSNELPCNRKCLWPKS